MASYGHHEIEDVIDDVVAEMSAENEDLVRSLLRMYNLVRRDYTDMQASTDRYHEQIARLNTKVIELESLNRTADIVAEQQRNLELTLMRKDLECANRSRDTILELTKLVFRNSNVQEVIYKSTAQVVPGHDGSYPSTIPFSETTTVTRTGD